MTAPASAAATPALPTHPPRGARVAVLEHRVPFYDTDGMRIVHHANYLRYLELARIHLLEQHDMAYARWLQEGLHIAVTRCEVRYRSPARFDDRLRLRCWLSWVRGASLGIAYTVERGDQLLATALTEHALVDESGRPVRLPRPRREALAALVG